jgi:hypothetical protein
MLHGMEGRRFMLICSAVLTGQRGVSALLSQHAFSRCYDSPLCVDYTDTEHDQGKIMWVVRRNESSQQPVMLIHR